MSHQAAREFLEKAATDKSFREKHLPSANASWDEKSAAAVRVGPQFGFQFTAQELKEVEGVKSFWRKVADDNKLQEKLKTVGQNTDPKTVIPAVAKIASEAGFTISPSLLEEVTLGGLSHIGNTREELSEADLEQVAGGATVSGITGVPQLVQSFGTAGAAGTTALRQSTIMCPW